VYQENLILKEVEIDLISFKATTDLDTSYMHEAMRAPDAEQIQRSHEMSTQERATGR
jgi:hypothetical protein